MDQTHNEEREDRVQEIARQVAMQLEQGNAVVASVPGGRSPPPPHGVVHKRLSSRQRRIEVGLFLPGFMP